MKHTPGPWRIKTSSEFVEDVWTQESHGSVLIAVCGGMDKKVNARLIAKAPEMLEALKEVQKYLGAIFPSEEMANKINNLIAEIEGGE